MSGGAPSVLRITLRHGIWRIWLDDVFFGDYRSKDQAVEGAETAQRAMLNAGKAASIVIASEQS